MNETTTDSTDDLAKIHRRFAVDLFNHVWTLLDMPVRTPEEDLAMVHATHASAYHWSQVGNAENFCIGEWQISRVYATLKRAEPGLFHGYRCLEIAKANGLTGFHLAFAFEALARAHAVAGDFGKVAEYLASAEAVPLDDPEDHKLLMDDLATIPRAPETT